jgi:S-phase kinase-associated protein 1
MGDEGSEAVVTLCSQEGENIVVKKSVIKQSSLVLTMIEDDDDGEDDQQIPLPNVRVDVLKKVIEFCEYHAENEFPDIEKPLKSADMQQVVGEWDAKYVEVEMEFLFELILAANYMDIKSLLDLTCAKVASMIKGKTPEEIRQTFNIVNDFTPEEEKQVREENKWCEEA